MWQWSFKFVDSHWIAERFQTESKSFFVFWINHLQNTHFIEVQGEVLLYILKTFWNWFNHETIWTTCFAFSTALEQSMEKGELFEARTIPTVSVKVDCLFPILRTKLRTLRQVKPLRTTSRIQVKVIRQCWMI